MPQLTLYHGSSQMVESPAYGKGRLHNDYGQGFYCTEHLELACEWACVEEGRDGFANEYVLETAGLRFLDLSAEEFTTLHWLALLMEHRIVDARTAVAEAGKRFLHDRYLPDIAGYDVIVGYRADDSYFTFARAFLRNEISLEQLSRSMRLGNLGEQVVLKSRRAFDQLTFVGAEAVDGSRYYPRRLARDDEARASYRREAAAQGLDGLYLRDLLREEGDHAGL